MEMETQIREALARGYCSPENKHKTLDPVLLEAMTRELLESFTPAKTDLTSEFNRSLSRLERLVSPNGYNA